MSSYGIPYSRPYSYGPQSMSYAAPGSMAYAGVPQVRFIYLGLDGGNVNEITFVYQIVRRLSLSQILPKKSKE